MSPQWTPAVKTSLLHRMGLSKRPYVLNCDYKGDALGTRGKSLKFMEDPAFVSAWEATTRDFHDATGEMMPDTRWRAHIAVWSARRALKLPGDFIDCGVFTGALAQMICRLTDFKDSGKNWWLFDTWEGVPEAGLTGGDLAMAKAQNASTYHRHLGIFGHVKKTFSQWDGFCLVQGILPDTLAKAKIDKVAYLSVDLNNSLAEKGCIEGLWDKIVPGGIVLIDDYGWTDHRMQQDMWDDFASSKGELIATLPTGQGLLVKS